MSDADDLARRFLALWADYLTALVSDPKAAELLQRWIAFTAQYTPARGARDADPPITPGWRPVPAAARSPPSGSTADAAAAAGSPGERDAVVAELARRLERLEERVAAAERRREAARPRRRNRTSGG